MIREVDLNSMNEVLELLSLQQLAYRVEAGIIGFKEIPPLLDSPQTLRESKETFFGFYRDRDHELNLDRDPNGAGGTGRLSGVVSCRQDARELTICRMMVHPDDFRRGIATALLQHVEQFAVPGTRILVSTGTVNTPAVALYSKHGYEPVKMQLVAPGITLTQFQKIV